MMALQKSGGYTTIAGTAGSLCKDFLPRLAAKLDVAPITDIIEVGSEESDQLVPKIQGLAKLLIGKELRPM